MDINLEIKKYVRGLVKKESEESGSLEDKIMDVRGVAKYIKLSERKIRMMVDLKEIPYSRVGGRIRFDRDEINRWFKTHAEKAKVS